MSPFLFLFLIVTFWGADSLSQTPSDSPKTPAFEVSAKPSGPPIDHWVFSEILKKYVNKRGTVDYRSFKRDKDAQAGLNSYLEDLMKIDGTQLELDTDRMAYWLNLYNGLVIREIVKKYPVQTTAQISRFFDEPRYEIRGFEGKKMSLLDIEQVFSEKFNDPRVHLARVNGALSSPPLLQEAFQAAKFEKQIEEVTMTFLKDTQKNYYDPTRNVFYASPIFMWFDEDFEKFSFSAKSFILSRVHLKPFYLLYSGFDWKLNDSKYR